MASSMTTVKDSSPFVKNPIESFGMPNGDPVAGRGAQRKGGSAYEAHTFGVVGSGTYGGDDGG